MKETRLTMGMPVTVEIVDPGVDPTPFEKVFDYFRAVDDRFSTYKPESEIMRINREEIAQKEWSEDMKTIFALAEDTKRRSEGFFDIKKPNGGYDPSGIVKGWAIWNATQILLKNDFENFYVDAGGDIQTHGKNAEGKPWSIGIKNPLKQDEIVKTIYAFSGEGVATSGTYIRGEHIYNPKTGAAANDIASITIIGPNIYEADRFATAAFAMGTAGIHFVEVLDGFEGYMIDKHGVATMTTGLKKYLTP
jgi:thiamine biosynthesis lipoprotein